MRLFERLAITFLVVLGMGFAQDLAEIRARAEQGNAVAQFLLSGAYLRGHDVPSDPDEALKWLRMSADQGFPPAQYSLGDYYALGLGGSANSDEAMKWYRLAADQGHPGAQFNLGVMYDTGEGVAQDNVQAYMWFALAAMGGEDDADRFRDLLAEKMTPAQIEEAERLAAEWRPSRPGIGSNPTER